MMAREYLGPKGLEKLQAELSGRDLAVIEQIAELRLMSTRQIAAVHFAPENFPSAVAAARACNRCLDRLVEHRVLLRLERRIGGIRAGSSSYIYALGTVGKRLMNLQGARRYFREPSAIFVDHTLAVSQLVVDVIVASRSKVFDVLACQAEPRAWRTFTGSGGLIVLRPDGYLALGVGEYEHRWFIEIDRGTEHLPALLRKCRIYDAYYRSGKEQSASGVFPRVCWLMPNAGRAERLRRAVQSERRLTTALFCVATSDRALSTLTGVAT
jgi:hypothetical protein